MNAEGPAKNCAQGFVSLASLIRAVAPEKVREARRRAVMLSREELLARFRAAHAHGKQITAFLMAEALVRHGVPPFVWHESLAPDDLTINQRYDLFLAELLWLRRWYRDHEKIVRYRGARRYLPAMKRSSIKKLSSLSTKESVRLGSLSGR